jgi:hypothetical protein
MLNIIIYSASFFYKSKYFKPILIYLIIGLICEISYDLILRNILLINGEQTNAPFGHLYAWTQLITFFYFFYSQQKYQSTKKLFIIIFVLFFLLSLTPYLWLGSSLMLHDPYVPLITMFCVIVFCFIYFFQLLDNKKGYPFITIGIFLVTGSSIIRSCVAPFWEGVDFNILHIASIINLLPLIIMQLLFMFEAYLFFTDKEEKLTVL